MANEIGFSLEIPDRLLDDLELVDTRLQKIAKQAKTTADVFNGQMGRMASGNITSLLQQLNKAKDALGELGSADKAVSGIVQLGSSSEQATDTLIKMNTIISQLADALNKLNTSKDPIQTSMPNTQGIDDISRFKAELLGLREAFKQDGNIDSYIANLSKLQQQYPNVAVQANILGTSLGKLNAISKDVKDALVIGETPTLVKESEVTQAISLLKTLKSTADEGTDEFKKYENAIAQYTTQLKAMRKVQNEPITATDALTLSKEAKSIAQRTEAIKQLKIARDSLNASEANYDETLKQLNTAIDKNIKLNNDATGATERLRKSQSKVLNITQQLTRQAALYFSVSQITGYVQKLASVRGEFELQQKSLQAIMQNKTEADKVWGQIVDLSVKSPFRLKELTAYTKQLAAYRVENDKIFETTKMLADVSAGLGVDMQRLILAYGQVKAANYLRGTELRQFSEAGINILGELSAYFTELEGRAISTAEVFEMVSKRMVTFDDVNKIFKSLTESGGIFYNMQEIQADTLAGKISNLNDAYDIMLNKIGENNEDKLKGSIDAVRFMVENYEVLVVILKTVITLFGSYYLTTKLTSAANLKLLASLRQTGKEWQAMGIRLGMLQIGFRKLAVVARSTGIALKTAFPMTAIFLLLDGLLSAISYYNELNEALAEVNKANDEQLDNIYAIQSAYEALNGTLTETNKQDEAFNKKLYKEKFKQLTELKSYLDEQNLSLSIPISLVTAENIDQVIRENLNIAKLASGFQAEFKKAWINTEAEWDGIIGIFGESLDEDLEDFSEAWSEMGSGAIGQVDQMQKALSRAIGEGALQGSTLAKMYYNEIERGQKANETEEEWLLRRIDLLDKINNVNTVISRGVVKGTALEGKQLEQLGNLSSKRAEIISTEKEALQEFKKLTDAVLESYGKLNFEDLNDAEKKSFSAVIKTEIDKKELNNNVKEVLARFAEETFAIKVTAEFVDDSVKVFGDFRDTVVALTGDLFKDELKDIKSIVELEEFVQKIYGDSQKKLAVLNVANTKRLDLTEQIKTREEELSKLQAQSGIKASEVSISIVPKFDKDLPEYLVGSGVSDYFDELAYKTKNIHIAPVSPETISRINVLNQQIESYKNQVTEANESIDSETEEWDRLSEAAKDLARAFGFVLKTMSGSGSSTNEAEKRLKAQIALIQKMNKEYEALRKEFSDEEALSRVITSFADSMEDVDIAEFMRDKGVTDKDLASIFSSDKFRNAASKAGRSAVMALNEAFGEASVEIDIDIQTRNLDAITKDIEDMFDQYDLTLQLEGLGFDANMANELFKFDYTSLDQIRSKMNELFKDFGGAIFTDGTFDITESSQSAIDAWNNIQKWLTDQEIKAQKDRNQKIYEILQQSLTEREKLEKEYLRDIKDYELSEYDDITKEKAKKNRTAQYKIDIAEQDYKDFQLTDEYVKAFRDLDNLSTATINHLLREFEKISKTPNLPTDAVKALNEKMQDLYDTAIERNPFRAFSLALEELISSRKEIRSLNKDLTELLKDDIISDLGVKKTPKEDDFAYYNRVTEALQKQIAEQNNSGLSTLALTDKLIQLEGVMESLGLAYDKNTQSITDQQKSITQIEADFGNFADVLNNSIDFVKDFAEGLGMTMDPETEAILDGITKGFTVMASAIGLVNTVLAITKITAEGLKASMWWLLGISAVIGGVFAVLGANDANRERIIEEETRRVKLLQAKYEKLQSAFEKSYKFDELKSNTDEMLQNIDAQILSLQRARAAEMDKKDSDLDAIDDYNQQIYDAQQQAVDLQNELTREFGGVGSDEYKDAAREFLEAWESAFLETGDGLSGLEDSFDEMIKNAIRSAAMSRVVAKYMDEMFAKFDALSSGGYTEAEIAQFQKDNQAQLGDMSDELEALYKAFGITAETAVGELSALQQGIQSITEPQAAAIEAYLNSIRFEVFRQGEVMNAMQLAMQSVGSLNNPENSIMYKELVTQTSLLRSVDDRLASVIGDGATSYIKTDL